MQGFCSDVWPGQQGDRNTGFCILPKRDRVNCSRHQATIYLILLKIHAQVGLSFPKFQPLSFQCSHQSHEEIHLHYHSRREGLAPMVKGLLQGLGKRFQTDVTIEQVKVKGETADHDEFVLEFKSE